MLLLLKKQVKGFLSETYRLIEVLLNLEGKEEEIEKFGNLDIFFALRCGHIFLNIENMVVEE